MTTAMAAFPGASNDGSSTVHAMGIRTKEIAGGDGYALLCTAIHFYDGYRLGIHINFVTFMTGAVAKSLRNSKIGDQYTKPLRK